MKFASNGESCRRLTGRDRLIGKQITGTENPIADCLISDAPFCGHSGQNRHAHVDIVADDHLALGVVETVQPAGILGKRAFPRDRQGKEKGIETGIIETPPR